MELVPLPGRPVRGSRTGKPLYALFELISRRWTLRIVWELQGGPATFTELQTRCDGMSTSTLTLRLGDLLGTGVVGHTESGAYQLTSTGTQLLDRLAPLADWAQAWADDLAVQATPPGTSPAELAQD